MFKNYVFSKNKKEGYQELLMLLDGLLDGVNNTVSNLSNASALLNYFLKKINWVGFYIYDDPKKELLLGPFQGLPACTNIPVNKGVCGTAASLKQTIVVPDVIKFPGHIACDENSKSEIVIPLFKGSALFGVLDIDSPILDRFDEVDKNGLEDFARHLENTF
jgi:GAF domain-containing protein